MKFQDHKIIHWVVYEIAYINDAIILGDIISVKAGMKIAQKKIDQAKRDLAKNGITDSFFMMSDFGGRISLSYEYKYNDGFAIKCSRIVPTGQLR